MVFFWGGDSEARLPVFDQYSLFDGKVFNHEYNGDSGIWKVWYSVNGTPTLVILLRSRDENSATYVHVSTWVIVIHTNYNPYTGLYRLRATKFRFYCCWV